MAKRSIKNPALWVRSATADDGSELAVFPNLPGITEIVGDTDTDLSAETVSNRLYEGWTDCRPDCSEVTYDLDVRQEETTTAVNRGFRSEEGVESSCSFQMRLIPDRGLNVGLYPIIRREAVGVAGDTTSGKIFVAVQHQALANGLLQASPGNPIFMAKLSVTKVPGGGRVNTLAAWNIDYPSSGEFTLPDSADISGTLSLVRRRAVPAGGGATAGTADVVEAAANFAFGASGTTVPSGYTLATARLVYANHNAPKFT